MKKLYSLATILVAATTLFACSNETKVEDTNENQTVVEGNETTTTSLKDIVSHIGENYIPMPLEFTEEEAKELYHVDYEVIEEYAVTKAGRQPGVGFAFVVKAKEGKLEEAKAIVEQVKQDQIGSAFYPDEVETAEKAEINVNGNYVALFVLHDDVREEAMNYYFEAIK